MDVVQDSGFYNSVSNFLTKDLSEASSTSCFVKKQQQHDIPIDFEKENILLPSEHSSYEESVGCVKEHKKPQNKHSPWVESG